MTTTNAWIYTYLAKDGKNLDTLRKNLVKGTKEEMVFKAQEIGLSLDTSKTKADMATDVIQFLANLPEEEETREEQIEVVEEVEEITIPEEPVNPKEEAPSEEVMIIHVESAPVIVAQRFEEKEEETIIPESPQTGTRVWDIILTMAPIVWGGIKVVCTGIAMFAIWAFYQILTGWDIVLFYGPEFAKKVIKVSRIALESSVTALEVGAKVSWNISTLALQMLTTVILVAFGGLVNLTRIIRQGWDLRQTIIQETKQQVA